METVDMDLTRSFLPLPTGGGDGVTSSGKGWPEKKPQEKAMETVDMDLTRLSLYPLNSSSGGGDGVTSSGKGPEKTPQEKAMEWLRKFDRHYRSDSDKSQLHPYVSWVEYQDEIRSELHRVDNKLHRVDKRDVSHLFPNRDSYADYVSWFKDYLLWTEDKEYEGCFDLPDDYNKDDDSDSDDSETDCWIRPVDLESVSEDHPDININQLLNLAIEEYNKKNGTNYSFVAIHKVNEQHWGCGFNFFVTFQAYDDASKLDDNDATKLFEALLWDGYDGDIMVRFCRLKKPSA